MKTLPLAETVLLPWVQKRVKEHALSTATLLLHGKGGADAVDPCSHISVVNNLEFKDRLRISFTIFTVQFNTLFNSGDTFFADKCSRWIIQWVANISLWATSFIFPITPERQPVIFAAPSVHTQTHLPQSKLCSREYSLRDLNISELVVPPGKSRQQRNSSSKSTSSYRTKQSRMGRLLTSVHSSSWTAKYTDFLILSITWSSASFAMSTILLWTVLFERGTSWSFRAALEPKIYLLAAVQCKVLSALHQSQTFFLFWIFEEQSNMMH